MAGAVQCLLLTSRAASQHQIAGGDGTIITDALSTWVNTSAAFDGTTTQTEANSAAANSHGAAPAGVNYIGKNFGTQRKVDKAIITGPSDNSLMYGGGNTGTIKFEGSQDGSTWLTIASFSGTGANAQAKTLIGGTDFTPQNFQYYRVSATHTGSDGGCAVAEIQFFETT